MSVIQPVGAQEHHPSASDFARLYVGAVEPQYQLLLWHDIPYYKDNTDLYAGRVSYHGVVYDDVKLRFDQLAQRVAVLSPGSNFLCLPEQKYIDWFEMDGHRYVQDPEDSTRYANLLCDGSTNGIRFYHSEWKIDNGGMYFGTGKLLKILRTYEHYTLITPDGEKHHVKRLSDVTKLFPEQKKQIRQTARKNHLSFSKSKRESSLVKVVESIRGEALKSVECRTESVEFATASNSFARGTAEANSTLYTLHSQLYMAVKEPNGYHGEIHTTMWSVWPTWESWTWKGWEGKPIEVEVYTHQPEVKLYLNDQLIGTKKVDRSTEFKAVFSVPYKAGTLRAEAGGESVTLKTAGEPARLRLTPDHTVMAADGQSLTFVTIEVLDKNGTVVPEAAIPCEATVKGAGTLLAFASADLKDTEPYTSSRVNTWKGRALLVVRSAQLKGSVSVSIKSSLPTASLKLKSK